MNWEKALITFPKLYPPQRSRGIKIWQKLWRGGTAVFRSRWLLQAVASSRASDGSESFIRGQYRLERRLPWASVQEGKGKIEKPDPTRKRLQPGQDGAGEPGGKRSNSARECDHCRIGCLACSSRSRARN